MPRSSSAHSCSAVSSTSSGMGASGQLGKSARFGVSVARPSVSVARLCAGRSSTLRRSPVSWARNADTSERYVPNWCRTKGHGRDRTGSEREAHANIEIQKGSSAGSAHKGLNSPLIRLIDGSVLLLSYLKVVCRKSRCPSPEHSRPPSPRRDRSSCPRSSANPGAGMQEHASSWKTRAKACCSSQHPHSRQLARRTSSAVWRAPAHLGPSPKWKRESWRKPGGGMKAVDTNIIVRYLTSNDPGQAARTRAVVDAGNVSEGTTHPARNRMGSAQRLWASPRGSRQRLARLFRTAGRHDREPCLGGRGARLREERHGLRRCVAPRRRREL